MHETAKYETRCEALVAKVALAGLGYPSVFAEYLASSALAGQVHAAHGQHNSIP
jgi:hypothetical protein